MEFSFGIQPGWFPAFFGVNKASAYQRPEIIDAHVSNKVAVGRVAGSFLFSPVSSLDVDGLGVVHEGGQSGGWRLVLDMSSSTGACVCGEWAPRTASFGRWDAGQSCEFGGEALVAKLGNGFACCNITVHPFPALPSLDSAWPLLF